MSTLNVANVTDNTTSVPTGYVVNGSAKSWVNLNGTGTIAIRDSLNVASLTDNATGDYSANFTSAMGNVNYSSSVNSGGAGLLIASGRSDNGLNTTGYVRVGVRNPHDQAWTDNDFVGVTVHGDLA
tara:strand:- start:619 stop:996 length:378 start_codon:yes stop_codon:yes gene_type:complete